MLRRTAGRSFQTLSIESDVTASISGIKPPPPPIYYSDVAVLAYPVNAASAVAVPKVLSATGQPLDGAVLTDADLHTALPVQTRTSDGGRGFVTLRYDTPQTIRSATIFAPGAAAMFTGPDAPR